MMEGLAFRYVFDYIQYTPDYFDDPTITMLPPSDTSSTVYTNPLVTKFLHEIYSPVPNHDFIQQIFFSNYDTLGNFYKMLRSESLAVGKNWVDILNAFHTQSYFTGTRAIPGIFIQDAPLLPEWSFSYDIIDATLKKTKRVDPYAMNVFAFHPSQVQSETLDISFQGDAPAPSVTYPIWSASCVLERSDGIDSIVHFEFTSSTLASLKIPSWNSLKDALFIVSNGDITASHNATISFQPFPVNITGANVSKPLLSMQVRYGINGIVEINYMLPIQGQTHIALYGINGRLIKELFNKYQFSGKHEIGLETSGLSSGIYFLKLQVDSHEATIKIPKIARFGE